MEGMGGYHILWRNGRWPSDTGVRPGTWGQGTKQKGGGVGGGRGIRRRTGSGAVEAGGSEEVGRVEEDGVDAAQLLPNKKKAEDLLCVCCACARARVCVKYGHRQKRFI